MRSTALLWFLIACSSSSPRSPDGGGAIDGGKQVSCGSTIDSYCTAMPCDRTLTAAQQDKALCPASLTPCGSYDVITKNGLDTSTTFYYFATQLVAIDHTVLPLSHSCVAGPAMFDEPVCGGPSQGLPACMP